MHALIDHWRKQAAKDHHTATDDVEDGVWAYQHEASGRAAARKQDIAALEAALAAAPSKEEA